jgi:hypothetical protein
MVKGGSGYVSGTANPVYSLSALTVQFMRTKPAPRPAPLPAD